MTVWGETAFLVILYGYINITAVGLVWILLRWLAMPLSKAESILASYLLGLGAVSLGVMLLGLAGWLTSAAIFVWLALIGLVTCREWPGIAKDIWSILRAFRFAGRGAPFEFFLQIVIIILLPTLLINALLPVWDYDALLYHLEIPRQFLAQGRIYFDPEVLRSAYPFLGEMLFLIGLVFRLASLAKLINLTYAVLFILSIYTFGKRFFGRETAVIAVAIWAGTPAFSMWATWASIDFAWAVYEFWGVYFVMLWLSNEKNDSQKWLALAGVMSGLAASTKYLSILPLLLVAFIIAWKSIQNSKQPFKEMFKNLLAFALCAGGVMGAWYIKNWIWTGNPVYPLLFGGPGWNPLKNTVLNDYVYSFGVGKNWLDYLLLPYNVYAHHNQFSTIAIEIIHPALWLAFLFPFLPRSKKFVPVVVYAGLYCISWAVGSQVIRFLIPPSAFLAVFAGNVIEKAPKFIHVFLKTFIVGGLMVLSLFYQLLMLQGSESLAYFTGQKSVADMLLMSEQDFGMIQHIEKTFQPGERAQFLWDGRGFYCDARCSPDDEQSTAVSLSLDSPPPQQLAHDLREKGFTYLMLSHPDADWFIAYHDPHGLHRKALDYFQTTFLPACGKMVFQDQGMELFKIECR
ncbi:MAG: glycosyltransferase family 39 protein [Anaerolineales bacterium]